MGNIIAGSCGSANNHYRDYDNYSMRRSQHRHTQSSQTTTNASRSPSNTHAQNSPEINTTIDFEGAENFEDFMLRNERARIEKHLKQTYSPQANNESSLIDKALVHQPNKDIKIIYDNTRSKYKKYITSVLQDQNKSPDWLKKMMDRWDDKNPLSQFKAQHKATLSTPPKAIELPSQTTPTEQSQISRDISPLNTLTTDKHSENRQTRETDAKHAKIKFNRDDDPHKPKFESHSFFASLLKCMPFFSADDDIDKP